MDSVRCVLLLTTVRRDWTGKLKLRNLPRLTWSLTGRLLKAASKAPRVCTTAGLAGLESAEEGRNMPPKQLRRDRGDKPEKAVMAGGAAEIAAGRTTSRKTQSVAKTGEATPAARLNDGEALKTKTHVQLPVEMTGANAGAVKQRVIPGIFSGAGKHSTKLKNAGKETPPAPPAPSKGQPGKEENSETSEIMEDTANTVSVTNNTVTDVVELIDSGFIQGVSVVANNDKDMGQTGTMAGIPHMKEKLAIPSNTLPVATLEECLRTPECGGEKFFSLNEESELSSISDISEVDHSGTDSDSPLSNPSTQKQKRLPSLTKRRRKPRSGGAIYESGQSGSDHSQLKWNYSITQLLGGKDGGDKYFNDTGIIQSTDKPDKPDNPNGSPPSMTLIYSTLKQIQGEARLEHKRAHLATKKLQGAIRKVNKSCAEITERTTALEERVVTLETGAEISSRQISSNESRMTDVMWKLEDFENRQRRNNLRLLGIPEHAEGDDIRGFVLRLMKGGFPELEQWDWEKEIQRVHRFPLTLKKKYDSNNASGQPRAILIFFGNFLLRQAVFDKARPESRRSAEGLSFFVRPDFCHITVERRWRLRQLITPFQKAGAEAFLLSPARLKIIYKNNTRIFTSEIQAQDYLKDISGTKASTGLVG